jgi:tetratricopeptide (TPR) repeat protein
MRRRLAFILIFSLGLQALAVEQKQDTPAEFQAKLVEMYGRTEKSIKLIREQILQNQSAPFLADLYMQLADLLSEKASVLYYQKIEKEKDSNIKLDAKEKSNPIVVAEQEAIEIYKQIIKEFPSFPKKDKVYYRMAVAHRAIDDGAAFVVTSEKLIQDYPTVKEAYQARLLLGQYYMDQHEFPSAAKVLEPAKDCSFPFERNSARHRLGIIAMSEEHYKEAMGLFEKVSLDEELKDQDSPLEVSIKDRTVKSNLRRDALIDSVRAYTEVYKKDPDPVGYYSKIIPTETLFQETIEKLAYRYIFLKNQIQAMKLLRTLSERVSDPQKVVSIYREVLSVIPPLERIEVPPSEMQYVLVKFSSWVQNFEVPKKVQEDSYNFFETQIREMGTKAHDLAKSELSKTRKETLYERARQFYLLYLGYFKKNNQTSKIATNLADVYYFQKNYMKSGDLYVRIFQGEFGAPAPKDKEALLQNAILCLRKKGPSDFYEIIRSRGLLLKSVNLYMTFNPAKKNDPQLNFVIVKGIYEQGLYSQALPEIANFIKRFPKSTTECEAAADLLLDYFNTRSDFKGLTEWSQKLLAIPSLPPSLRTRLTTVKSKAMLKQIDEQVKGKTGYDPFAQGKVYFETAMSLQDETLRSAALEQALAKSKAEKDIGTFLRVARTISASEKTPDKRAQILSASGDQTLAIGRFYQTLGLWREVLRTPGISPALQQRTQEKILQLSLMLKDWNEMLASSRGVNSTLASSVRSQLAEGMESAASIPESVVGSLDFHSLTDQDLTSFYKGMFKTSGGSQQRIASEANARCQRSKEGSLCRWLHAGNATQALTNFANSSRKAPATLESIEKVANSLNGYLQQTKEFTETGDPQLDIFGSLHTAQGYLYFTEYLNRTAAQNPSVAQVLKTKADESKQNGQRERAQCQKIITQASLISPINKQCYKGEPASLATSMSWSQIVADSGRGIDPKSPEIDELQKKIFSDATKATYYLDLAAVYFKKKYYHQALAVAQFGSSTFSAAKEDFAVIQGCSLTGLGLYNEGQFFLKSASDFQNLKSGCMAQLKERAK